jgi:hypothetical protein
MFFGPFAAALIAQAQYRRLGLRKMASWAMFGFCASGICLLWALDSDSAGILGIVLEASILGMMRSLFDRKVFEWKKANPGAELASGTGLIGPAFLGLFLFFAAAAAVGLWRSKLGIR